MQSCTNIITHACFHSAKVDYIQNEHHPQNTIVPFLSHLQIHYLRDYESIRRQYHRLAVAIRRNKTLQICP